MQRLQFESSPYFILICLLLGVGYAYILYKSKHPWSQTINRVLFVLRAVMVSLLAFLLLGPILKLTNNIFEKPAVVFLIDNSTSMKEVGDSTKRLNLITELHQAGKEIQDAGYDVLFKDLNGNPADKVFFNANKSDINSGLKNVVTSYEGKNLNSIVLVSDGIYNSGTSPIYTPARVPVYTVGVGDTTLRSDLLLKDVVYNKIAYQGNKFPIHAEVLAQRLPNSEVKVSVFKNGKVVEQQQKNNGTSLLTNFDFLIQAQEKGIHRYDVVVETVKGESTSRNNRSSIYIEVVEGKKRILLIAPAPHPDIKAIRTVVEKNANYEFILHIPGIADAKPEWLKPGAAELVIFHQAADRAGRTTALLQQFQKSKTSLLLILGTQTNFRQLSALQLPLSFDHAGQWDEVTPIINESFRDFNFVDNTSGIVSDYPPVEVPFGKFTFPTNASVLMYQRIGSVATQRPLLFTWQNENQKMAALVGEGIWRWRLNEYSDTENTEVFDDVFLKLIQYMSTLEDKKKFKSFPTQSQFSEADVAIIESQVYNDLFEPVYGNTISLELRNEANEISRFQYVTSPGGTRYQIGGLREGVYQYKASTEINGKRESASGQFLVVAQTIETQNLTADFNLLRKLSTTSQGKFFSASNIKALPDDWRKTQATALIHSNETFNPLINLKWFFFLLLALISGEWFLRKYMGGY
ncbi:MAG: VWA domain-containing protein [Cyclobacteriaceae bacterium]|nr:VWA domain-containing protein [Cyclobacteriaceae bacterium]